MLIEDKDRKVIPRWRDSRTSAALGEMDSLSVRDDKPESPEALVAQKVREWKTHRSVSFASDVVATALSVGLEDADADEAAGFVADHPEAPPIAKAVAKRFLGSDELSAHLLEEVTLESPLELGERRHRIHRLRKYLIDSPRNVLARADLALEYASLGMAEQALRAMEAAVKLAPDNRFVLRSAARLLVHVGATDEALKLLRESAKTRHDPWLLAAEIATAGVAHRPPRFAKMGLQLLSAEKVSAFHVTELASAVGTLEAESGLRRNARRLFRKSLVEPNENSVAQAKWAAQRLDIDEFEPKFLEVRGSFEARALDRLQTGRLADGVHEAWLWLHDQPFSKTAAVFGSYLASVGLGDNAEAVRFISAAQIANPQDPLLLNNLAFTYGSEGRLEEAKATLALIPESLSDHLSATVRATHGLVLFRSGEHAAGRGLYLDAVSDLHRLGQKRSSALASLFRAREEILADTSEVDTAMAEAREACGKLRASPEIDAALERVEEVYASTRKSGS